MARDGASPSRRRSRISPHRRTREQFDAFERLRAIAGARRTLRGQALDPAGEFLKLRDIAPDANCVRRHAARCRIAATNEALGACSLQTARACAPDILGRLRRYPARPRLVPRSPPGVNMRNRRARADAPARKSPRTVAAAAQAPLVPELIVRESSQARARADSS